MLDGMNTTFSTRGVALLLLPLVLLLAGCEADSPGGKEEPAKTPPPPKTAPVKKEIGKNVFLETDGNKRRVLVNAYVCRREGQLEHLMCRKKTKEHEAILAADLDARNIHLALLLARAEPGSTVKFVPKPTPPKGTRIKITLQYEEKGKTVTVAPQKWIRNIMTKKDLEYDWVFAGSQLIPDPLDPKKPPFYLANDGDVICLANFETALLDLPVLSSKDNDELVFEAHTERIPALETRVVVILEPVPEKKK
jgi:hypothetical protein